MKARRVVDCNLCEMTVPQETSVTMQIHATTPLLPKFELIENYGVQHADICQGCWSKIAKAIRSAVERLNDGEGR